MREIAASSSAAGGTAVELAVDQVHSPAILAPGVPPQTLDPILGFAGRRERRELRETGEG